MFCYDILKHGGKPGVYLLIDGDIVHRYIGVSV